MPKKRRIISSSSDSSEDESRYRSKKEKFRKKNQKGNRKYDILLSQLKEMERKLKSISDSESGSEEERFSEENIPEIEENIDNRVLEALGKNPTSSKKEGEEVHEEVAVRWRNYLVEGIDKEVREQLVQKYPIPKNCTNLKPPTLNPEIEVCLSKDAKSQDFVLSQIQSQLASGLAALAQVMTRSIKNSSELDSEMLTQLADSGQILCNVHNFISKHRRHAVKPYLKSEITKCTENCPIDDFLFGKNLNDSVKASQALKKVERELKKATASIHHYPYQDPKPGTSGIRKAKEQQRFLYKRPQYKTKKREYETPRRKTYQGIRRGIKQSYYRKQ